MGSLESAAFFVRCAAACAVQPIGAAHWFSSCGTTKKEFPQKKKCVFSKILKIDNFVPTWSWNVFKIFGHIYCSRSVHFRGLSSRRRGLGGDPTDPTDHFFENFRSEIKYRKCSIKNIWSTLCLTGVEKISVATHSSRSLHFRGLSSRRSRL